MRLFSVVVAVALAHHTAAADPAPAARAKAIVDAQLVQIKQGVPGLKAFLGQLDPKARIVASMAVVSPKDVLGEIGKQSEGNFTRFALAGLFELTMDLAQPPKQTVTAVMSNLTAGGRTDAVWFTFDLAVTSSSPVWKGTHTYRITELAVDRGGWKVTLFHFDRPMRDGWDALPSAGGGPPEGEVFPSVDNKDDSLAKLLENPAQLAKSFATDPSVVVLGSSATDRAIGGTAAGKLIGGWSKLKLSVGSSVEDKTKTWGYAVVRIDLDGKNEDQKMRMFATIIAIPKGTGWEVVTVRYSRLMWI